MKTQMNRSRTAWVLGMGIFVLLNLNSANATCTQQSCIEETSFEIGRVVIDIGKCELTQPLSLVSGSWSYPKLFHKPYRVDYWAGAYEKIVHEKVSYQHEVFNRCTGETRFSELKTAFEKRGIEYPINNPNLSPQISASYQLVPMTPDEAKQALAVAKARCEEKEK